MKKTIYCIACFLLFFVYSCKRSSNAFELIEIPAHDLIPEGIEYDQGDFYLSGLHQHKIIQFNPVKDEMQDFISENYNGYGMGVGMKIDEEHRELIALSSAMEDSSRYSMIHYYDLDSGKEKRKILVKDSIPFFFNDLDIDNHHDLYISDTEGSRIFYSRRGDTITSEIYQEKEMYPNGIALDDEDRNLYIASWQKGILRLDLNSMETSSIHPEDKVIGSQGIDGLYFYKKSLIGIQNGYQDKAKHKILRFFLDDNYIVTKTDTLAMNHSSFDVPTTGVIVGDRFYCLANSQLENLNQETNEIIDSTILKSTTIIGIPLKEEI